MALRKEQIVLIGTVGLLGFLAWKTQGTAPVKSAPQKRAAPPTLVPVDVPDTSVVLPAARTLDPDARDLFSPPSDTRPLPPLALVPPPSALLAALRPPPSPGPGIAHYGRFLRTPPTTFEVPDLFAEAVDADAPDANDAPEVVAPPKKDAKGKLDGVPLTPEQVAARLASRKRLYDWIRIGDYRFGEIRNPNRYELSKRPNEDVLFVEYDPDTGLPRMPGQPPTPVPRKTVAEFDFAQTIANQIEIRRVGFGDPLPASEYDLALEFADWCVEQRLETPRALVVAEEMFRRASAVLSEDPAPRLGLARVWEASFQFEKAFGEYEALRAGNLKGNPLVLVSLGRLEARFRLVERARARLFEAEKLGRNSWQVQEALGVFLLDQGEAADAVAHLRVALQVEPQGVGDKRVRARLRTELGAALLANGDVAEGREWIEKALQSDPNDAGARAALVAADVAAWKPGASDAGVAAGASPDLEAAGFDMMLARGLAQSLVRTPESARTARTSLLAAAALDPLRAYRAWRALSYLAEITNHPDEALRFVDLALENQPLDAWSSFQRGRLLARKDDLEGAAEAFKAALDRDIGFVDALAALGELSHRRGDFASADRYFERALVLDPGLVDVQALRGVNFLEMGAVPDAEDAFKAALAKNPDQPTARNGQAWCYYRRGDATEAIARLRELDDNRRSFPADDPHRAWAKAQIDRLTDHLEKVAWTDRFERTSLMNGWGLQEQNGPTVAIHDGLVTLAGAFKSEGRARLWQTKNANDFVSVEARITIHSGTNSRVGLFVSREQQRGGETQVEAEVTVSRHHDASKNALQVRNMKRGQEALEYADVPGFDWKPDVPVVVRIERIGEKDAPRVRITVDGVPVLDGAAIPSLGRTTNELRLGVFAEGQVGRTCAVDVDDFEIVYRERGK